MSRNEICLNFFIKYSEPGSFNFVQMRQVVEYKQKQSRSRYATDFSDRISILSCDFSMIIGKSFAGVI
ncbi:hypothetical protein Lsai_2427 [Legionella sainthelensi]|uniref:Uncharacterized protein n=1 Tax=Legionella sainthelensi TaxID=28087 RepID=A0A0W0YE71_9GAMM|nr:hypothetical protein [Legionella sainthelensi]KTD54835.1 hypothetical protein Lsai_2427 [Legionella sainthelensi]VEH37429.1 Uncharacterised protein [Legionella sainthelensi]